MSDARAIFFVFSFLHHGLTTVFQKHACMLASDIDIDASPLWPRRIPHAFDRWLNWCWSTTRNIPFVPSTALEWRVILYYFYEKKMYSDHRLKRHRRLIAPCHHPSKRIFVEDGDPRPAMYRVALVTCVAMMFQTTGDVEKFGTMLKIPRLTYSPLGVDCNFFTPHQRESQPKDRSFLGSGVGYATSAFGSIRFGTYTGYRIRRGRQPRNLTEARRLLDAPPRGGLLSARGNRRSPARPLQAGNIISHAAKLGVKRCAI